MDESTEVKLKLKYKRALKLYDEKCSSDPTTTACNALKIYTEKSEEALVSMKTIYETNKLAYYSLWVVCPCIAAINCCDN